MKKARKHPTQQTTPRKRKSATSVQWARSPSKLDNVIANLPAGSPDNAEVCEIVAGPSDIGQPSFGIDWYQSQCSPEVQMAFHGSIFAEWRSSDVKKDNASDVLNESLSDSKLSDPCNDQLLEALDRLEFSIPAGAQLQQNDTRPGAAPKSSSNANSAKVLSFPGTACEQENVCPSSSQPKNEVLASEKQTGVTSSHNLAASQVQNMSDSKSSLSDVREFHAEAMSIAASQSKGDENFLGQLPLRSASSITGESSDRRYLRLKVRQVGGISMESCLGGEPVRHLRVWSKLLNLEGNIILSGRWTDAPVCVHDTINLVLTEQNLDALQMNFTITVDDMKNFIVIRPDVFICPTRIADANSCLRKVVLSERLAIDAPSKDTIIGHMKHSLFEIALRANRFDEEFLHQMIQPVVRSSRAVEDLFRLGMNEDDAAAELVKVVRSYSEWGRSIVGRGSCGQVLEFGIDSPARIVNILEILSTEENIWSPMWGMKGSLDVTALVSLSDPTNQQEETAIVPIELKTGKVGTDRPEHRAQIMLYSLLLSDRYYASTVPRREAGILVRSSSNSEDGGLATKGVRNVHVELRELVMIRNRIAVNTSSNSEMGGSDEMDEREKLPIVTGNVSGECSRCFQRDSCVLVHVGVENGTRDSMNVSEDEFDKAIGSLSPDHLQYYSRWHRILECEGKFNVTSQRDIWTKDALLREAKKTCLASLTLRVVSESEPTQMSQHANVTTILELTRSPTAGAIQLADTYIQVGDLVLISAFGAHLAVCKGHVMALSRERIAIKTLNFPRYVHSGLLKLPCWCVDRLEVMWGNRFLQGSLASLFVHAKTKSSQKMNSSQGNHGNNTSSEGEAPVHHTNRLKERMRSLIIDMRPPRFWDPDQPGKRSIRECDLNFLQQLFAHCDTPELVRRALFAKKIPVTVATFPDRAKKLHLDKLTTDQARAVAATLAAQDYLCIIGAPGSGKTTTIAFIVDMLHQLGKSVLVSSFTHAACDNLLLKIKSRGVNVLRIGLAGNVRKELKSSTLPEDCTVADLEKHLNNPSLVCGATCLGVKHALIQRKLFDYCILDEAGQLAEPFALGPFTRAKCTLLVGDPKQLPPLVVSKEAKSLRMEVSLFERLVERHPNAVVALTTQFRMNREINGLANELFYQGQLVCGSESVTSQRLNLPLVTKCFRSEPNIQQSWLFNSIRPDRPVVFLDTDNLAPEGVAREYRRLSKQPDMESTSTQMDSEEEDTYVTNQTEALIVHLVVDRLMRSGLPLYSIGVISPYRSQLRILRRRLVEAVEVDTVDKFQGRDKECIVISLVRSNPARNVGSLLSDWRRLNVAFTRAKCKLIIVGSGSTLMSPQFCTNFLQVIRRNRWDIQLRGDDVSRYPDPGANKKALLEAGEDR